MFKMLDVETHAVLGTSDQNVGMSGVMMNYQPKQCIIIREIPQNPYISIYLYCLSPPKWVPFNDPCFDLLFFGLQEQNSGSRNKGSGQANLPKSNATTFWDVHMEVINSRSFASWFISPTYGTYPTYKNKGVK